ncbi:hypothetical protein CEUSTIGMA_g1934.t1 [Chlamydomonas eustigma]|uniref:Acyltransferase n=1 Tax=Chlamydomonas eustigma TaxID=1157962 RepID=A0A250WUK9_9CHLO|nr:hypothetical protein CEUSTIGMA_g1934.t1 [Chlamydomonas eustigma]|eukprot:GAX74485.1 hypothetical protein CEUSTIGMA_g1934.t1 [Chlamydomonas eustigma]
MLITRRMLFSGGPRHFVLKTVAWLVWIISGSGYLALNWRPPFRFSSNLGFKGDLYVEALAVAVLMGVCFMLKAALAHEPRLRTSQLLSPTLASAAVILLCLLLCGAGQALLITVEQLPSYLISTRVAYCLLALSCLLVAATSIHGLAGWLRFVNVARMRVRSRVSGQNTSHGVAKGDTSVNNQTLPKELAADVLGHFKEDKSLASDNEGSLKCGGESPGSSMSKAASLEALCEVMVPHLEEEPKGPNAKQNNILPVLGDACRIMTPVSMGLDHDRGSVEGSYLKASSCMSGALTEADLGQEEDSSGSWRFWQPFKGGKVFVATQALGWTMFTISFVYVGVLVKAVVMAGTRSPLLVPLKGWVGVWGAGALMFTAPVVLALSLLAYEGNRVREDPLLIQQRGRKAGEEVLQLYDDSSTVWDDTCVEVSDAKSNAEVPVRVFNMLYIIRRVQSAGTHMMVGLESAAKVLMPVLLMYSPLQFYIAFWAILFVVVPMRWFPSLFLGVHIPYYILTTRGNPQHTGSRRWPWLVKWFGENLDASMKFYFGGFEIIRDFKADPDPSRRYIFGFHPHGLYPTGAGLLPLSPTFKTAFHPEVCPVTLTASIVYWVPAMRDILMWAGMRQVNRSTFITALKECGSVLVCPGGQAELIYTHRLHMDKSERELVIYAGHKGFIRLAVQHRACLVPVLALGEARQFRDAVNAPSMQKVSYKKFGFPFPYFVTGRWGFAPFPDYGPVYYVLGEPIEPPECREGNKEDEDAAVELLHQAFYRSMVSLFLKYRHLHPDYEAARIRIITKH